MVAAATAQGRSIERVRIFARPLTDYTRFEFAAYSDNIAAGEKVRVIDRSLLRMEDRSWANEDFWIFDDEIVVILRYDPRGCFLGADRADEVQHYLSAEQRAIRRRGRPEARLAMLPVSRTTTSSSRLSWPKSSTGPRLVRPTPSRLV
ncbi:MAG: DUF6879 family protein [Solirubrobacteraceae bacterium]